MKQTLKQTLAAILAATMMTAMFSTGAAAAEQSDAKGFLEVPLCFVEQCRCTERLI